MDFVLTCPKEIAIRIHNKQSKYLDIWKSFETHIEIPKFLVLVHGYSRDHLKESINCLVLLKYDEILDEKTI